MSNVKHCIKDNSCALGKSLNKNFSEKNYKNSENIPEVLLLKLETVFRPDDTRDKPTKS